MYFQGLLMTDLEFNECMAMLFAYYSKKVDPTLSVIYARRFIKYDYKTFYTAVNKLIDDENYNFFPKTHELKKFLPEIKQLVIEDKGGLSWCDKTQELINKYLPSDRPQNIKVNK